MLTVLTQLTVLSFLLVAKWVFCNSSSFTAFFFYLTNTDYSLVELAAQLKKGALPPHQQYILSLNLNRYLLKNYY